MKVINDIFKKKISRIMMFVVIDIIILGFTSILSVWMRFDFGVIPREYFLNSYSFLIIDAVIMLTVFHLFRLYRSFWSYASVPEMMNIVAACTTTEVLLFVYKHLLFKIMLPRSTYLIQLLLLSAFVIISRFSYRIVKSLIITYESTLKRRTTMVIGAGEAGRLLIDEILRNQKLYNTKIECIIDDDRQKTGVFLRGIPIVGTRRNIIEMADKYEIEDIVIAIPSAPKETISEIVEECQKTNCQIKILPSIYKSMNEGDINFARSVRPLSYEDFLGRDQIVVDTTEIASNIKDKVILVTGGGGSIGSELCRQIAKCEPKSLIIFDIYENNAYDIQQELFRNYPNLDLHTIIGSVRDYDRLEKVFKEFKPNQVFHAAAHKHVPLMEVSPNEAIKNNCLGTLNACKLADKYKVERFVLISTDKAVRPTNAALAY